MKKLKMLSFTVFLLVIATFMIACNATSEEPSPEPAAVVKPPADFQAPTTKDEVPRISAEELKERLDAGEEIVVADTRSEATFGYGHITGAISVPDNEVELHLDELPLDQEIVLYCS